MFDRKQKRFDHIKHITMTEVPILNVTDHFDKKTNDNQTVSLDMKEISDSAEITRMIHVTVRPMLIIFGTTVIFLCYEKRIIETFVDVFFICQYWL